MSRGSIHDTVLCALVKDTFSLLLDNDISDENREQLNFDKLVAKLDAHTELLRSRDISNELHTSLTHLKSAVVSLRACFEIPNDGAQCSTENSTNQNELQDAENDLKEKEGQVENHEITNESQNQDIYTSRHTHLQNEVSQIQAKKEFTEAMQCFTISKDVSAKVFKKEKKTETKITAIKVRVISEILGNLTNLRSAATECMKHISELHGIFKLQNFPFPKWRRALLYAKPLEKIFESQDIKCLNSVVHIDAVVFRFIKEFMTKPVPMLQWTTISFSQKILHPLLGTPLTPRTIKPDLFIDMEGKKIDSQVCALNCNGEIFTKEITNSRTGMISKE